MVFVHWRALLGTPVEDVQQRQAEQRGRGGLGDWSPLDGLDLGGSGG